MATQTTEATGHAADAAASAPGMPQLDFSTWGNQIFWLIVTLVVIYFILSRVALPRVASVLSDRAGAITNDIAAAEELKQKAVEAEAAYDQALADARVEAGRIVAEARAEIQAELDAATAKADAEIAARTAEGEKAIADIRANAARSAEEVARETAAAVITALGFSAEQATVDAAVDAKLKG
ncbi:F0F1 ATP synthase subunit B' [Pseudooceanicola aestuarii]|uniref:F0F1 ATP synthase subunit B' n=1 Tax=Pseudooceanicola aestuarii TaxID=2697319 RepID=UPI0013D50BF7|nr:F0F1 ATP synthase subunit B' [Pseudooceanicola aestuarii]